MLTAIVLELQPTTKATLPLSHGVFSYAAALSLIERLEPNLPKRIHNPASHKPITTSPVWGGFRKGKYFKLFSNKIYRWRLTGLDETVSTCLNRINPNLGNIRIGNAIFRIIRVVSEARDDKDVGETTYEDLWHKWHSIKPPAVFPLRFDSPTTFRRGNFEEPFPVPYLVFSSLLETWNAFSPRKLGDFQAAFKQTVYLANWKGETRRVEFGSRGTVGFVGGFTYRVIENLPEICRLLGLLIDYAFYAGVGWQTTHGLGQTSLAE